MPFLGLSLAYFIQNILRTMHDMKIYTREDFQIYSLEFLREFSIGLSNVNVSDKHIDITSTKDDPHSTTPYGDSRTYDWLGLLLLTHAGI